MIEAIALKLQHIINRQLFSEAYLQERRAEKFSHDTISAEKQTIREWREAYLDLNDDASLQRYVGSCLSTLRLPYSVQISSFTLYTNPSKGSACGYLSGCQ